MSSYSIINDQTNETQKLYRDVRCGYDSAMHEFFLTAYDQDDEPAVAVITKIDLEQYIPLFRSGTRLNVEQMQALMALADGVIKEFLIDASDFVIDLSMSNILFNDFIREPTMVRSEAMQSFIDDFQKGSRR